VTRCRAARPNHAIVLISGATRAAVRRSLRQGNPPTCRGGHRERGTTRTPGVDQGVGGPGIPIPLKVIESPYVNHPAVLDYVRRNPHDNPRDVVTVSSRSTCGPLVEQLLHNQSACG